MSSVFDALEQLQLQRERADAARGNVRVAGAPAAATAQAPVSPYPPARPPVREGARTDGIRAQIDSLLASRDELDRVFAGTGGLEGILSLCDKLRREVDRVSAQEIDQLAAATQQAVERLLTVDYELRRLQELKRAFGGSAKRED